MEYELLTSEKPIGTNLLVREYDREKELEARVARSGIVRQRDGPAAFTAGIYEIVEEE